jgi:hypothetical protein
MKRGVICSVAGAFLLAVFAPAEASAGRSAGRTVACQLELKNPVHPERPSKNYPVQLDLDERGFPREYSMPLLTDICLDRVCNPLEATLVWDAIGNFLRLEISPQSPLTKGNHDPFTPQDYERLHEILKHRESILGKYPLEAFVIPPVESDENEVDGVTSATPQSVQDAVVAGAAYSSWVLWRWVNGEAVDQLRKQTEAYCTAGYLEHCLTMEDLRYQEFALRYLLENQLHSAGFTKAAFQMLEGGRNSRLALQYLTASPEGLEERQLRLAALIGTNAGVSRPVLDYFEGVPNFSQTLCDQLAERLDHIPEYYEVHRVLTLLEKHSGCSDSVLQHVEKLLARENRFIVRRAREFLEKQPGDS